MLRFRPLYAMTPDEFYQFCLQNPDMRAELTAEGEIVSMSPSGGGTGARNAHVVKMLGQWADRDEGGSVFDSSTGFILPNGAVRSPDASWVRHERLVRLSPEEIERSLPLCPDLVIEVASPSDRLADLQTKMDEYIANGAQLGWLIVPEARTVFVYRPGQKPQRLSEAARVDAEPLLPGFVLDLNPVWKPLSLGR
jgi:Uma2 family endonuclease